MAVGCCVSAFQALYGGKEVGNMKSRRSYRDIWKDSWTDHSRKSTARGREWYTEEPLVYKVCALRASKKGQDDVTGMSCIQRCLSNCCNLVGLCEWSVPLSVVFCLCHVSVSPIGEIVTFSSVTTRQSANYC